MLTIPNHYLFPPERTSKKTCSMVFPWIKAWPACSSQIVLALLKMGVTFTSLQPSWWWRGLSVASASHLCTIRYTPLDLMVLYGLRFLKRLLTWFFPTIGSSFSSWGSVSWRHCQWRSKQRRYWVPQLYLHLLPLNHGHIQDGLTFSLFILFQLIGKGLHSMEWNGHINHVHC